MKTSKQLIDNIVANFNYDKVKSVMEFLRWEWYNSVTESKVPSIGELVMHSARLLEEVHKTASRYHGAGDFGLECGGFCATATKFEDGEIILSLKFVVSSWENLSRADLGEA